MRVFSYVVAFDSGFAPNPFGRWLTLACCKPVIRRSAEQGDIIVGLTRSEDGSRVVYVAQVAEKLTYAAYWADRRFRSKRPTAKVRREIRHDGDNIYEPLGAQPDGIADYRQLRSRHSNGVKENLAHKRHDLGGKFVLVCRQFSYFGDAARPLPESLQALKVGRGHRSRFPAELVAAVDKWRRRLPRGRIGTPLLWRERRAADKDSGSCA